MKFPIKALVLSLAFLTISLSARAEENSVLAGAGYGAATGTVVAGTIIFTGALLGTKRMPRNEASLMGVGFVGGAIGGAGATQIQNMVSAPEAQELNEQESAPSND
jgi:hypothetical protein